jgi:hypothetical protein
MTPSLDELPQPITVETTYLNGVEADYLVGAWPSLTEISGALLRKADASKLYLDGERIVIRLANGSAVYRHRYEDWRDVYVCTREA